MAGSGVSVVEVIAIVVVVKPVSAEAVDSAVEVSGSSSVDTVSCCDVGPFCGLTVEASARSEVGEVSEGGVGRAAVAAG